MVMLGKRIHVWFECSSDGLENEGGFDSFKNYENAAFTCSFASYGFY